MKKLLLAIVCLATVFIFWKKLHGKPLLKVKNKIVRLAQPRALKQLPNQDSINLARLKQHAFFVKKYVKQNGYNQQLAFIVDFKIPSGRPRFFVYDLLHDSIISKGLVAHGSGLGSTVNLPKFGNTLGCLASSKGFYKIGLKYTGEYGIAYKLHGLQNTNSKALERSVVLHSHACVPSADVFPQNICMSYGCPTLNPTFMAQIIAVIDNSDCNILLSLF